MSENQKTNAELIYRKLIANGLTPESACAILGNLDCESNLYACRMQGDFTTGFTKSAEYAAKVNSGAISREVFKSDGIGWGIYQLTFFTRKAGFYDLCKQRKCSIADLGAQIDYLLLELRSDFPGLLANLKANTDMYEATDQFCRKFERPYYNNIVQRYQSAQKWYSFLKDTEPGGDDYDPGSDPEPIPAPDPVPSEPDKPETPFWPFRGMKGGRDDPGLCKGMVGCDVLALQAILTCQGYGCKADGVFGTETDEKLRQYQTNNSLTVDGVAGHNTWASLLTF